MKSFSVNFPSIALIPVALFVIFLSIFIISEWMFDLEAYYRGYDTESTTHYMNIIRTDNRTDSCFIKANSTQMFCKQEFGMLGWKQWFTPDEQNQIIEKFPTIKIEPEPTQ